ncbi:MAG: transglutaminase-like domain-containing protein [Candidatus Hodarchaeota archaeon]
MSTERLEKDPAPAAIRYLVLTSAFTSLFTGLSFILTLVGTSTQEEQFYEGAIIGFTLVFVVTMVEWFVLRRSRKLLGPYGFGFVLEISKFFLFSLATAEYIEAVPRISASPFFLHQLLSLGIIFLLALTKIARTRIDQLAQKDISRNVLNLLPTLLILVIFLGTYITEIVGLGTPRQRSEFEDYEKKNIDWSLYNTPTWDATYLLENLLDQFTAGIKNPYNALFNVSNNLGSDPTSPPAYWRIGSLETYELLDKGEDPTTRWTSVDPLGYRVLTPYEEGVAYSSKVDDRIAEFTVQIPLDYSTESVDVSVNPNFPNYLPTTWNGKDGSYIDENSFKLYADENAQKNDDRMSTVTTQTKEVYPGAYGSSVNDLLGIQAYITTDETSSEEGIFEYTVDYADISETLYDAAAFSKTKDDYQSILGSSEWANIQDLYLQYPNTSSKLPVSAYVHTTTRSPQYYRDWAPWVAENASGTSCSISGQSVFSQAYAEMLRLAPNYFINTNEEVTAQLGIPNSPNPQEVTDSTGEFNLAFDFDMWLGQYASIAALAGEGEYEMPHPKPYEDYNEWFMYNKQGTALHFASLYVTMMRLRGIPSRVVIGYLGGTESTDKTKLVITNMMLHAWAEVLIPIEEIILVPQPSIDRRAEWVSFDPLLKFLSDLLNTGVPIDMPVFSEVSNTVLINSSYDYRTFGPATFHLANYTTTDVTGSLNLVQNDINISVRVMMITGAATWMPWQPACKYLGTNVNFYWGNTRNFRDATQFGSSSVDSSGYASVLFDFDVLNNGSPVWFFAHIAFDPGGPQEHKIWARSIRHSI